MGQTTQPQGFARQLQQFSYVTFCQLADVMNVVAARLPLSGAAMSSFLTGSSVQGALVVDPEECV